MRTIQTIKCGDYYEILDDDARTVAKALGITLCRPNSHAPEPFKSAKVMCGIPCHAIYRYNEELERDFNITLNFSPLSVPL